jgi:hypothetical protein
VKAFNLGDSRCGGGGPGGEAVLRRLGHVPRLLLVGLCRSRE